MDLNMDIPKAHLYAIVIFIFLLGGFVMGYTIGNYVMNERWDDYLELYKERVDRDCVCMEINTSNNIRWWEYGYNETNR